MKLSLVVHLFEELTVILSVCDHDNSNRTGPNLMPPIPTGGLIVFSEHLKHEALFKPNTCVALHGAELGDRLSATLQ